MHSYEFEKIELWPTFSWFQAEISRDFASKTREFVDEIKVAVTPTYLDEPIEPPMCAYRTAVHLGKFELWQIHQETGSFANLDHARPLQKIFGTWL